MGVLLEVQGKELDIILFKKDIILKKPILSIISNISEKTPKDNNIKYTTFIILSLRTQPFKLYLVAN
jgi:hypothetical protein